MKIHKINSAQLNKQTFAFAQKVIFSMAFLVVLLIGSVQYYMDNSISINQDNYRKKHEATYNSEIQKKTHKRAYYIHLSNQVTIGVERSVYDNLKTGDIVFKPKNSDSVFIKSSYNNFETIVDINKQLRHHLNELKKEK